ncbi:MAG: D-lyxose/D-mannose family sugar isomerase [Schaedlerella sp.]|nr:D-lyxose/D-mannose family sugar isomerase [Schaedlerella sp.]
MKRSRINQVIKDMEDLIREHGFEIPPFAKWTSEDWKNIGHEYDEIRENCLGWDITDYGLDNFDKVGFALLTIRNGNQKMSEKYPKTYAEKLLMLYEDQTAPMHYHWNKMEDIINRGGNDIYITVYNGAEDKTMLDTDVTVYKDGKVEVVPAGTKVRLTPGESITIPPYMYHDFIVPKTGGAVLLGEVSMCNDDENDNCFYEPIGRFPQIEEDEPAYRLLCNEYPDAK